MTTRYSQREGAPLQEWAGGNEGCWATARPAAPPPTPSREALAKSTSSPPSSPSCEHSPLRHPQPHSRGRYSSLHPGHATDQHCSVLFFIIPLLTLLSLLSPNLARPLSRSFIAFFISCVVRVRCTPRAPSSRIFRLAPLTRHNASGDFYVRHS